MYAESPADSSLPWTDLKAVHGKTVPQLTATDTYVLARITIKGQSSYPVEVSEVTLCDLIPLIRG